ncbi:MAG: hypothetical protein LC808_07635 [Actinobacteria bacterium]|nr:hypothetical protein [Actinomycetota bacterium]
MSNGSPTPPQAAKVQANLTSMQQFNDYVYDTGAVNKVTNAFLLLSEQDKSDPGVGIGLNVLESAFRAIGSLGGPAGTFAASFLSGMLSWWATPANTPSNLNTTFSDLLTRLEHTKIAVDAALAGYYQTVANNWNTQFTYNGQTVALSDFATVTFPVESDPVFEEMATAAIFALDQSIWTTVMNANYVITNWKFYDDIRGTPPDYLVIPGDQNSPPVSWDQSFLSQHPAYYNTWNWQHFPSGGRCNDPYDGWLITQYNIGTAGAATCWNDGSMSSAACAYLFIDSADGVVINANGLFRRATVFSNLGIPQVTQECAGSPPSLATLSMGYLRAMKEGKTVGTLILGEGREAVEKRVIDKAHRDPIFAFDLAVRPRQTLEEFLGVRIPEVVAVNVIVESGRNYGLVVPMPPRTS